MFVGRLFVTVPDPDDIMTVKEVAEYLKFSESTIYRMVHRGDLPAQKIGGGWRFSRKNIDAQLNKYSQQMKTSRFDDISDA